ncbi:hypothetical protein J1N35_034771 [Gossypium stocksii]|uniref:Uncharacterized protein n=1 Tax=Gossypium stocksii TaxID=47602 RepID=A0A9D3ZPI7_9ROSI|nr:hypothetical protein J1N35_034771 [Gossypium stocksii]
MKIKSRSNFVIQKLMMKALQAHTKGKNIKIHFLGYKKIKKPYLGSIPSYMKIQRFKKIKIPNLGILAPTNQILELEQHGLH